MTDPIETLVRRAQLERAAATRPDLARIRAALPALSRRRNRRRRTGFALAAVAAVLAVAAIVRLPDGTFDRNLPAGPPSPSPSLSGPPFVDSLPAPSPERQVAMFYVLEQPPGNYRERLRTIEQRPDGVTATRTYQETAADPLATQPEGRRLTLTVRPGSLPGGDPVDVGPVRGVYEQPGPGDARVTWPARLGGVVSLDAVGTGLSRDQVLQVAGSVTDRGLFLDKPLILRKTPGQKPILRYSESLTAAGIWSGATATADASAEGRGTFTATVSPWDEARKDGEFASLNASPANFFDDPDGQEIVQQIPYTALALTIRFRRGSGPPMTKADFLAAAEAVEVRG